VGYDLETEDRLLKKLGPGVRRGGRIVGISFSIEGGPKHYLPFGHNGGGNLPRENVLAYVRDQAAVFQGELVGAHLAYDLDYSLQAGIDFKRVRRFRDVLTLEALIDELKDRYNLDSVGEQWGEGSKDEALLTEAAHAFRIDPKKQMFELHSKFVGPYAIEDADKPLRILRKQETEVAAQNLHQVWDLESRLLPVLVRMRRRGVRIDQDQLDKVERFARAEEAKALSEVHRATGVEVPFGHAMRAEKLAPALEFIGVTLPRTKTGKPSIDKNLLEGLKHPVADFIRRARKMSQLRTTFVGSIRDHVVDGRIHCTFNQVRRSSDDDDDSGDDDKGGRYGRMSCTDPNLQQQPSPDRDAEIGAMWRRIYIPEAGSRWWQADYSQQEPKQLLHFAVEAGPRYIGGAAHQAALRMAELKHRDPNSDDHTAFTMMVYGEEAVKAMDPKSFKLARARCKNIFLGICYGMGGPKLCRNLGLPTKVIQHWRDPSRRVEVAGDEGQALLDLVDSRAPYVRAMAKALEKLAKERGFITTLCGRRCRFPKDALGNWDWTHKALNRLIQGSSADQTKEATIAVEEAGHFLQLQVHDELDGSSDSDERAKEIGVIMRDVIPMKVPMKVDVECGPNWADLKVEA
jgi:DNA polymerase I-like protein with 3'-5' exonuclease and polymerase domains